MPFLPSYQEADPGEVPSHTSCPFQVPKLSFSLSFPGSSYSRLLNSYTHFNTQLKCYSLQKGLPASYLPTELRTGVLRTAENGPRRRKESLLLSRAEGNGQGRNRLGMPLGTCLNGRLHQVPRNEIAGLARIQTGHLATGWALETARVIDVGWGRGREGEWNSTLSLAMTQAEVRGRWCQV